MTQLPPESGPSSSQFEKTHESVIPAGDRRRLPLIDSFQRVHRSLRISVTDRCNIRCKYCMPADNVQFLNEQRLLKFEEIESFVRIVAVAGIRKVRITGGEPLMRPRLEKLIGQLAEIAEIEDIALTTNGMMLADQAAGLKGAGLKRINISLDTLNDETFRNLSRRDGLKRVIEGIDAAVSIGNWDVQLNALVMRHINFDEVIELVEFARDRDLTMRFIEFMPLDADRAWSKEQMVTGEELRQVLQGRFGPLIPIHRTDQSRPSHDYEFESGGRVGFIDSVTEPFCGSCDRLRLTADGKLRNCLFSTQEWDVRPFLVPGEDSEGRRAESLMQVVRDCLAAKRAAHGIDSDGFQPPERAMYQIGG